MNETKVNFIAKVRHLAWCSYQMGAGQEFNADITEEQLESLKQGVKFALENPDMTSEENHINWMKMKESQGWVYGEVKDIEKKTHPDLVPYAELPEVERAKDDMDRLGQRMGVELWGESKTKKTLTVKMDRRKYAYLIMGQGRYEDLETVTVTMDVLEIEAIK